MTAPHGLEPKGETPISIRRGETPIFSVGIENRVFLSPQPSFSIGVRRAQTSARQGFGR
jgi:hypothetical protein